MPNWKQTPNSRRLTPNDGDSEQSRQDLAQRRHAKQQKRRKEILSWIRMLAFVVVLGLLLNLFVIQRNSVVGKSMYSTLEDGDQIFVQKVTRYLKPFARGAIVTLDVKDIEGEGDDLIIKRVIGLPGETVDINNGEVYINGERLEEPYLDQGIKTYIDDYSPHHHQVLGEDEYWVMGDNRPVSRDSRHFGPVHKHNVIGELWFRVFPLKHFGNPDNKK